MSSENSEAKTGVVGFSANMYGFFAWCTCHQTFAHFPTPPKQQNYGNFVPKVLKNRPSSPKVAVIIATDKNQGSWNSSFNGNQGFPVVHYHVEECVLTCNPGLRTEGLMIYHIHVQ